MLRRTNMRAARAGFIVCFALVILFVVSSILRRGSGDDSSDIDNDIDKALYPNPGKATPRHRSFHVFADDPGLELPRLIESVDDSGVDINDLRIAILEHTDWHDEVIIPIARLLQELGLEFDIYRHIKSQGSRLMLYALKRPPSLQDRVLLSLPSGRLTFTGQHGRYGWLEFMRLSVDFPKSPIHFSDQSYETRVAKGLIDVTIHISGDAVWDHYPKLSKTMRETPTHQIICLYHQIDAIKNLDRDTWQPVARGERLQFVTLSPRSTDVMRDIVLRWADAEGSTAWHTTGVNTIVPVIPLDYSKLADSDKVQINHLLPRDPSKPPSRLAIVGGIADNRRKYNSFIRELSQSVQADPALWGYQLSEEGIYTPDTKAPNEPVKLFLIGALQNNFKLIIPEPIKDMVEVVAHLNYNDFYHMLSSIDLLVPAFASDIYISKKISAAIPLGVSCRVPILANERLLRSYSFLREPAVVLRPSGMSEVEAIAVLRRGAKPWTEGFQEGMANTLLPPAKGLNTRLGLEHVEWNHKKLRAGTADVEWDVYHEALLDINTRTMLGMLRKAKRRLLDLAARVPLEADDAHI